jgi:U32 family peptidase
MRPELLAPAGNLEKVKWAIAYGADAVYFGTEFGSLRSFAGNLTFDEAEKAMRLLHRHNKKGYVALNIYPFSDEYEKLIAIAKNLDDMAVDAFIISDLGLLCELKKLGLGADFHISTQANTTSSQTVLAYKELGASRVNLARELSLVQIKQIQKDIEGAGIKTEVFIHGAVCFSYSGRCAISDYLTGRRANRGECTHPCRWGYSVVEEQRPNEYFPVFEDERGQYIFNSKDLALFPFVPELTSAGVNSFKIEGRMKSIHYMASVVSFYRQVIDGKTFTEQQGLELLNKVRNRGYSSGFMKGQITPADYAIEKSQSNSTAVFVGNILDERIDNYCVCEVRNKIFAGESLEILRPDGSLGQIVLPEPLLTREGEQVDFANNSQFVLLKDDLGPYTILRRVNPRSG